MRFFVLATHVKSTNVFYIQLSLLILAGTLCGLYTFDPKLDANGGNADSFLLGKALTYTAAPEASPGSTGVPESEYAPLYPQIIGWICKLSPGNDSRAIRMAKILNGFLLVGSACLFFFILLTLSVKAELAFVSSLFLCINANLWTFACLTTNEILFLFLSLLFVFSILRLDPVKSPMRSPWVYCAVFSGILLVNTKSVGVAFIYAVAFFLIVKRRWMHFVLIFVPVYFLAMVWAMRYAFSGANLNSVELMSLGPFAAMIGNGHGIARSVAQNLTAYVSHCTVESVFPFVGNESYLPPLVRSIMGRGAIAVMAYGILKHRESRFLIFTVLVFYIGALLAYPGALSGVKFFLPLVPWCAYFLVCGLIELLQRIHELFESFPTITPYGILVVGILSFPNLDQLRIRAEQPFPPDWQNFYRTASWVKQNTPQGTVVYGSKPALFSLIAGRPTAGPVALGDVRELLSELVSQQAEYVVVDNLDEPVSKCLAQAVEKYPAGFHKVFETANPNTAVFEVISCRDTAARTKTLMLVVYEDMEKADKLLEEKRYQEALPLFLRASDALEHSPFRCEDEIARVNNNLAFCYLGLRQTRSAYSCYTKVLDACTAQYGSPHPKVASALFNLGSSYDLAGNLALAEDYYNRSLRMRHLVSRDSADRDAAIVLTRLGCLLRKEKRLREARDTLEKAIHIWEKCELNRDNVDMALFAMRNMVLVLDSLELKEEARDLEDVMFSLKNGLGGN